MPITATDHGEESAGQHTPQDHPGTAGPRQVPGAPPQCHLTTPPLAHLSLARALHTPRSLCGDAGGARQHR